MLLTTCTRIIWANLTGSWRRMTIRILWWRTWDFFYPAMTAVNLGRKGTFLPIAQAMGIRIVLASSGVARNNFRRPYLLVMHARTEVVSLYYEDPSSWCIFAPLLYCRLRRRLLVCSEVYSHQDCHLVSIHCVLYVGTNLSVSFYQAVQWSLLSKWL